MGKSSINGPFSMVMLNNQRVESLETIIPSVLCHFPRIVLLSFAMVMFAQPLSDSHLNFEATMRANMPTPQRVLVDRVR